MKSPEGALTDKELEKLRGDGSKKNRTKVYFVAEDCEPGSRADVDNHGVMHGEVREYSLTYGPPNYYFYNYWMAYAHAIKLQARRRRNA